MRNETSNSTDDSDDSTMVENSADGADDSQYKQGFSMW